MSIDVLEDRLLPAASLWTGIDTNTFAGRTDLKAGVLSVKGLADASQTSDDGISYAAAASLIFNGGTLQFASTTASSTDQLFTLKPHSTVDVSGSVGNTLGFTNVVSTNGDSTLTATGSNTGSDMLTPSVADSIAGPVTTSLAKTGSSALAIEPKSLASSDPVFTTSADLAGSNLSLDIGEIRDNAPYTILQLAGDGAHLNPNIVEGDTISFGDRTFKVTYNGGGQDAVTVRSGDSALNADPHSLPHDSYIAHGNPHSMIESVVRSFSSSVAMFRSNFTFPKKDPAPAYVPDLDAAGTDNNTLWTVTLTNRVIGDVEQFDNVHHWGIIDGDEFQALIQDPGTALHVGAFDFDGGDRNLTAIGADFQALVTNFGHSAASMDGFNG